jgi:type II secretion system protein L
MGQHILAIEMGTERVRAALVDRSFKSMQLLGLFEEARAADEADLSGAVSRIIKAAGPRDVVITALPAEYVAKRLLRLPFTDRRRLQQVVPFALEEHLPFAVDDAAVAFARVGRDGDETLVVAAVARKVDLQRHLEMLARAAVDPKTVTLSTFALAGFLTRAHNGNNAAYLVVELDEANTSMVLIDANGTPRAMRTVKRGFDGSPRPAGTQLDNPMLSMVRQTLLAHRGEQALPELVLAGPAAGSAGIREQFVKALDVPVREFADFDLSPLIQGVNGQSARFAGCLAMLLSEAPVTPLELINFRQGEFAFHGASGAAHPWRFTAALGGAAVAVALLHLILSISVGYRQLHLLDQQIEAVTNPILGNTDPASARTQLQAKIADLNKQLRMLGGNLGHGSPLDVLRDLSQAIPPAIPIQADTLVVNDSGLKLEGSADSFATVDQIKRALERSGDFGAIQVEHAGAGSDTSKVEFRLSAALKDGANY